MIWWLQGKRIRGQGKETGLDVMNEYIQRIFGDIQTKTAVKSGR